MLGHTRRRDHRRIVVLAIATTAVSVLLAVAPASGSKDDRLVGHATFTADSSSIGVPVGSEYTVSAGVARRRDANQPSGRFSSRFLIETPTAGLEPGPARLDATRLEWLADDGSHTRLQGLATLNGAPGWKFRAEVARDAQERAVHMTVAAWRPGISSLTEPDYRFGGPRDTGNLLAR